MTPKVSKETVDRFIAELSRPKWINKWATPAAVRAGLEYAMNPYIGFDGKYECDKIGCNNRVDVPGEYCEWPHP